MFQEKKMWFCMKSEYENKDWYHEITLTKEFPTIVKYTEIHELPNVLVKSGYIICHFSLECDWVRFYENKDDAEALYLEKSVKQILNNKSDIHYYKTIETETRKTSSRFNIYPHQYAEEGDRWIMEKVTID